MNQREASKQNWSSNNTTEEINAGSFQRIADAVEKMSENYIILQDDRDWYKRRCNEKNDTIARLERKISALKGVITKLKTNESNINSPAVGFSCSPRPQANRNEKLEYKVQRPAVDTCE